MNNYFIKLAGIASIFALLGCNLTTSEPRSNNKTLFEIINKSKTCEVARGIFGGTDCSYRVGDFFKISIAAIGTQVTGIHFEKSDSDKPIYASFGTSHGCVIVNRFDGAKGAAEFVFISPKNGLVYNSWQECEKAS